MEFSRKILIAADQIDERVLYARTIMRKYPQSVVTECDLESVQRWGPGQCHFDAAVIHFNGTPEAHAAVAAVRRWSRRVPIVALSGVNRGTEAIAAGVDRFILADQWLLLAPVLADWFEQAQRRALARAPSA
ncbi:MAG: hypothetical protein C0518_12560 [Opitutus sp.]|nr:hypothetical protein [Opitutus sp.]